MTLFGGVVGGKVRVGLRDVVVVGEHEQLGRPRVAVCLQDRRHTGGFELVVVGFELGPGLGHADPILLEDLLVVQDAAAHDRAERHAENLPVLRHGGQEHVLDVGDVRLLREVDERVGGVERLQQRAGVVEEDVVHLARGQTRLDQVVAVGASWPGFDGELHIRVLGRVGSGERVRHVLRDRVVAGQDTQGHGCAASAAAACVAWRSWRWVRLARTRWRPE